LTRTDRTAPRGKAFPAAILLILALLPLPSFGGGAGAAEALLARVAAKYAATSTLSARFRQEIPLKNVGIVRKASGKLWFSRPSRMRWDYAGGEEQIFLSDGKALYFRPPGSPQVFRRSLDEKGLGGKIPMLLLFGQGDITSLFRAEGASPAAKPGTTALRLVPKGEGAPEVTRVDLVVGDGDLSIREIHIHDRLGGANHIYLEGILLDAPLPAELFRFRKPAGAEVVEG
jgi:outer membrane lipoprotein carrier protein